jgi:hypothetical protein
MRNIIYICLITNFCFSQKQATESDFFGKYENVLQINDCNYRGSNYFYTLGAFGKGELIRIGNELEKGTEEALKWSFKGDTVFIDENIKGLLPAKFLYKNDCITHLDDPRRRYCKNVKWTTVSKVNAKKYNFHIYDNLDDVKDISPDSVFGLSLNCNGYKKFPKELLKFNNLKFLDLSSRIKKDVVFLLSENERKKVLTEKYSLEKYNPNHVFDFPEEIAQLKQLKELILDVAYMDNNFKDSVIIIRLQKLLPNTEVDPNMEVFRANMEDMISLNRHKIHKDYETIHYRDGKVYKKLTKDSYYVYYPNGKLKESATFDSNWGLLFGNWTKFNEDGSIREVVQLDKDRSKNKTNYDARDLFFDK